MLAWHITRPLRLLAGCRPNRRAGLALSLSHTAGPAGVVAKRRDLDLGNGDRNEVLAAPADELTAGDVLFQIAADGTTDDLLEAVLVALDAEDHGEQSPTLSDPPGRRCWRRRSERRWRKLGSNRNS